MLVILGSLFLPFASRMASQAKEVEMLSTEELQRNQQLISQIYTLYPFLDDLSGPFRLHPTRSSVSELA